MGIGIGLMLAVGIGAATLSRAQQSGEKRGSAPTANGELRERVLKLRTEIDIVQVEFDAVRAKLFESLKAAVESAGDVNEDRAGFREFLETIKQETLKDDGRVKLNLEGKAQVMSKTLGYLGLSIPDIDQKLLQDWLAGGPKSKAAADRIEQIVAKQGADEAKTERETIERLKKEFARISRKLNEMKLNLAKLEKQYEREAP